MRRIQPPRQNGIHGAVAATLLVLLALSACSNGNTTTQKGVLEIGAIVPQSGVFGAAGAANTLLYSIAQDDYNNAGGITIGSTTYQLKFDILDDRSDPTVTTTDAIQLIRDNHVSVIMGVIALGALAVVPVAAQRNVIEITPATPVQPLVGSPKYPLLFAGLPPVQQRGELAIDAMLKFVPNAKKIAFMAPNESSTAAVLPVLTAVAQVNGLTIDNFAYPPGTTDLSTVATRVRADNPDIVFNGYSAQEMLNVLRTLNSSGVPLSVPLFAYSGSQVDWPSVRSGREIIDYDTNPGWFPNNLTPSQKVFQDKRIAKAAQLGITLKPSDLATYPSDYTLIPLIIKAMQKAGTITDTAAIAKAMTAVSTVAFDNAISYDASHQFHEPFYATFYPATGSPSTVIFKP